MTRIVSLGDTHGSHFGIKVPNGDVLVHCGDFSSHGGMRDSVDFMNWFGTHPHPHKLFCAGNHDWLPERDPGLFQMLMKQAPKNMHYLQDGGITIKGLKFWMSPYSPRFYNWAFNCDRGEDIKRHWDMIPVDTDVLITHGPPYGICDEVPRSGFNNIMKHTGCKDLLDAIKRIKPKIWLGGHIHYSGGKTCIDSNTTYANVSVLNEEYQVVRGPTVFDIDNNKIVSILQ